MSPSDEPEPPGVPRWVTRLIVIGVVIVVAMAVVMLLSGGEHGPGRHLGAPAAPGFLAVIGVPA